jgi:hypothetical protein
MPDPPNEMSAAEARMDNRMVVFMSSFPLSVLLLCGLSARGHCAKQ